MKGLMKLRDAHHASVKKEEVDPDAEDVMVDLPVRQHGPVEKGQVVADGAARASVLKFYTALDAVEMEAEESVGKGASFKERMLKNQLWTITSALSDALRDVLGDRLVKNKIKAVRMVVDEFVEWLEEQVGDAVKKEEEVAAGDVGSALQDGQDQVVEAIEKQTEVMARIIQRLQHLEKQHPGRQSRLGGEDIDPDEVQKAGQNGSAKGFKGLNISLG